MNVPFSYASPTLSVEALKHSIAYKLMFIIGKDPAIDHAKYKLPELVLRHSRNIDCRFEVFPRLFEARLRAWRRMIRVAHRLV